MDSIANLLAPDKHTAQSLSGLCGYIEAPADVRFPLRERVEYLYLDGPAQLHPEGVIT